MKSLRERALLVQCGFSGGFGRYRVDKRVTKETNERENAARDAGNYHKRLGSSKAFREINRALRAVEIYHDHHTMYWDKPRVGLIAAENFMDYAATMRTILIPAVKDALGDFIVRYPQFLLNEEKRLGNMFRAEDYPKITELSDLFNVEITPKPIPDGSDLRVDIPQEELDRFREDVEAAVEQRIKSGVRKTIEMLMEPVKHMAETLAQPDKNFHGSLVGNVLEITQAIPDMNAVVQDPRLEQLRQEIEQSLLKYEPKELKLSVEAREETAQKADEILKKMEGYL